MHQSPLENGADIRSIQALLGLAKRDTPQIYTPVSIRQLKQVHTLTHPAKMGPEGAGEAGSEIDRGDPA